MRFFYFYAIMIAKLYDLFLQFPCVATDTRNIKQNCIFFALNGENFNGNAFAAEALKKGAAYAIIDEKKYSVSEKTIVVKDTLLALQQLAHFHRKRLDIPILAITGTNGKTTTKELIAAVLSQKFNIKYTQGNLNNHIGVPLTLLEMNSDTEFGIVEMGANHPGEIAKLCEIADPDYGIITNIGKAHLEGFGSFEGIKKTKAELYQYISNKKGTIFFNNDNNILNDLTKRIEKKKSYGTENADFTGELVKSPPFVHVRANFPKGKLYLNTALTGSYNFENILVAACVGNHLGIEPLKIQKALKQYKPTNNRSQLVEKGNLKIIMDAYNANPTSMQASIKSFLSGFSQDKTYLILGDMLELGTYSTEEHQKILSQIENHQVTKVFLTGPVFSQIAKNNPAFKVFPTVADLCSYLAIQPIKSGTVLVKGSRGIQLEKVLEYL